MAAASQGLPGDRALDFGPARNGAIVNLPTVAEGEFDSIVENDAFTIAFWAFGSDDLPQDTVVFGFYHDPLEFGGDQRMISAHLPWSNSQITYDTGGCCSPDTNRISQVAEESEFKGQWNHYAFLKDGERTAIHLNGELWLEGFGKTPMNPVLYRHARRWTPRQRPAAGRHHLGGASGRVSRV